MSNLFPFLLIKKHSNISCLTINHIRISALFFCSLSRNLHLENLTSAIDYHHLKNLDFDVCLMVDDGSENKGAVHEFISKGNINMKKVIAMVDIIFSNSMVEAVNKRIKYDYLFRLKPKNFKELELLLPDIVINYNNRPHSKLYGLHPLEVLSGQISDPHKFTQSIKAAVSARRAENLKLICADCPD